MTFYPLSCSIHESTVRHAGPCPHCTAFHAKLDAEWAADRAPKFAPERLEESTDVDPAVLRREHEAHVEAATRRARMPRRSVTSDRPKRVGNFCHQASKELRRSVVQRARAGELVRALAREVGFSKAAIYSWLADAGRDEHRRSAA